MMRSGGVGFSFIGIIILSTRTNKIKLLFVYISRLHFFSYQIFYFSNLKFSSPLIFLWLYKYKKKIILFRYWKYDNIDIHERY